LPGRPREARQTPSPPAVAFRNINKYLTSVLMADGAEANALGLADGSSWAQNGSSSVQCIWNLFWILQTVRRILQRNLNLDPADDPAAQLESGSRGRILQSNIWIHQSIDASRCRGCECGLRLTQPAAESL
jgi:hypothetical protein